MQTCYDFLSYLVICPVKYDCLESYQSSRQTMAYSLRTRNFITVLTDLAVGICLEQV
jgi:hypothetical protein